MRLLLSHFNSQPHEEADTATPNTIPDQPHFNSQPHEEADTDDATFHGIE